MSEATRKDVPITMPSGWSLDEDGATIGVRLKTKDFMSAIGLINEIAMIAERLEHHPDFHLTGWNQLEIRTYSHDVGMLTDRDVRLAGAINDLLATKKLRPI